MHAMEFKLQNHSLFNRELVLCTEHSFYSWGSWLYLLVTYMPKAKTTVAFKPLSRHFNFSSLHSSILTYYCTCKDKRLKFKMNNSVKQETVFLRISLFKKRWQFWRKLFIFLWFNVPFVKQPQKKESHFSSWNFSGPLKMILSWYVPQCTSFMNNKKNMI